MGTETLLITRAITLIDVRDVMSRIHGDLRVLRAHYRMISEDYELKLADDLLQWVYRSYAQHFDFSFYDRSTMVRSHAVRYSISRAWTGDHSDRSGDLRYAPIAGSSFHVTVTPNRAWTHLGPSEQRTFYATLQLVWGPETVKLIDAAGSWTTDHTYGSGGLGATRSVFHRVKRDADPSGCRG